MRGARSNVQSPSHSLRSCSGPAATKPVYVKSALVNLPECAAEMGPARHRPMGTNCSLLISWQRRWLFPGWSADTQTHSQAPRLLNVQVRSNRRHDAGKPQGLTLLRGRVHPAFIGRRTGATMPQRCNGNC
jgi:hypothetical protein